MGFLDKKERILDVVLTDKGRELLSRGELKFSYYAFSDEGVDYRYCFNSASYEDKQYRTLLAFEADQRKDKDLKNFLYTSPATTHILPKMQLSISGAFTLQRQYKVKLINEVVSDLNNLQDATIVFKGERNVNQDLRNDLYVTLQKRLGDGVNRSRNLISLSMGSNITKT